MKKIMAFLIFSCVFGANLEIHAGELVRQPEDGFPISDLAEETGMDVMCFEGFLHVRNGAGPKIILNGKPIQSKEMIFAMPIRCDRDKFYLDMSLKNAQTLKDVQTLK